MFQPGPRATRGFWFVVLALLTGTAEAAPYRPTSDAEVLERLPARSAPLASSAQPLDAALAVRAARVFIERGRRSDDPRDYGYAQGLLRPWWTAPDAPDDVLLLRATLRQHRHEFDAALADIDRVLARNPGAAQAWLTRATIHRVRGNLDASRQDCQQLTEVAPGIAGVLCRLAVVVQREPRAALAELEALAPRVAREVEAMVGWYLAERSAAAERAGDAAAAEAAFLEGRERVPGDIGLRAAHADFLLNQGRANDALVLLADAPPSDSLLLRELIALSVIDDAHGPAQAAARREALTDALSSSYEAVRRRGDAPHLREEGLFALHVQGDAIRALDLAQQNWRDQRELADARLLLAAALAAGDRDTTAALRTWCEQAGVRDVWLETRW